MHVLHIGHQALNPLLANVENMVSSE